MVKTFSYFFPIVEFINKTEFLPILIPSFMADFMPIKHELPILQFPEITTLDVIKQLSSILQWCPNNISTPKCNVVSNFLCKVVLFDFLK